MPSTAAGPRVNASTTRSQVPHPAATPASRSGTAVSKPEIPKAASWYSTSFRIDACGA